MPYGPLRQVDSLLAPSVDQAYLHPVGVGSVHRELRSGADARSLRAGTAIRAAADSAGARHLRVRSIDDTYDPAVNGSEHVREDGSRAEPDPDLLIDFDDVLIRRGGVTPGRARHLEGGTRREVGRARAQRRGQDVAAADRGRRGAPDLAASAHLLGEVLGRVDVSELRPRIGLSSSALAHRVPADEMVRDLVVSAGYARARPLA